MSNTNNKKMCSENMNITLEQSCGVRDLLRRLFCCHICERDIENVCFLHQREGLDIVG